MLTITILPDADVERHAGDVPVYALARPIVHTARIVDPTAAVVLDDPRTSQATILSLWSHARRERALFELSPSQIDVTGEITAPPTQELVLSPGQPVDVPLALLERCGDWCLVPGWFELHVELHLASGLVAAAPLRFGIELAPASLPILLAMALHPATDPWARRQAFDHLQRVPDGPRLEPPRAGETATEAAAREADNRTRADAWLASPPGRLARPEAAAFFARQALGDPPPALTRA